LKVGIIGTDRNEWHIKRLLRELEKKNSEAYLLPITKMKATIGVKPRLSIKDYPIEDYDAVIVRRVPGGTAEQVFYRMDTLHLLASRKLLTSTILLPYLRMQVLTRQKPSLPRAFAKL